MLQARRVWGLPSIEVQKSVLSVDGQPPPLRDSEGRRGKMTSAATVVSDFETRVEVHECSYTWTLENLRFLMASDSIESPNFSSRTDEGTVWGLSVLVSTGPNANSCFSLNLRSCKMKNPTVKYKFSFKDDKQQTLSETKPLQRLFRTGKSLYGEGHTVPLNKLSVKFTVCCTVSYALIINQVPPKNPPKRLKVSSKVIRTALGELFKSSSLSDMVISVKGQDIRVHKAVLAARSPVFKSMLEQKPETSRVEISNMEEATLRKLLEFIYTGHAEDVDAMINLLEKIDQFILKDTTLNANPPNPLLKGENLRDSPASTPQDRRRNALRRLNAPTLR